MFDFDQFMSHGFSYWPAAYNVIEESAIAVRHERWVEVGDHQWAPTWESSGVLSPRYSLLVQWMDFFVNNAFGPSFKRIQTDLWMGSKELPYHNCDVDRVQLFAYLGADEWHPEAGGRLLIRNELSGQVTTIEPTLGTCVILNGLTQGYQHAVEPMNPLYATDRVIFAVDYKTFKE